MTKTKLALVVAEHKQSDPFYYEMTRIEFKKNVLGERYYSRRLGESPMAQAILKKMKDGNFYFIDEKSPIIEGKPAPYFHYFLMSKEEIKFYQDALNKQPPPFNYTEALKRGELFIESKERLEMLKNKYNF